MYLIFLSLMPHLEKCPGKKQRYIIKNVFFTTQIKLRKRKKYQRGSQKIRKCFSWPTNILICLKPNIKVDTLKFKMKWKFGGHIFGHIFWTTLFSKKYFTVNAIHEIPETNGYDSPRFDRALNEKILFRYLVDCIHCEIFFEKSVIQKIWPKMWPPNFHLISNFNLPAVGGPQPFERPFGCQARPK